MQDLSKNQEVSLWTMISLTFQMKPLFKSDERGKGESSMIKDAASEADAHDRDAEAEEERVKKN